MLGEPTKQSGAIRCGVSAARAKAEGNAIQQLAAFLVPGLMGHRDERQMSKDIQPPRQFLFRRNVSSTGGIVASTPQNPWSLHVARADEVIE
jgi:hypothetical protein